MPGVSISTAVRTGPASQTSADSATYFVVGLTERGPVGVPTTVRSLTEYISIFGARTTYGFLYDDVQTHFEEGGLKVVVQRVAGTTPVTALLSLVDRAVTTPLATLTVKAKSVGAWGNNLSVKVEAGGLTNTFTLTILENAVPVEVYKDLASPAAAVLATANSTRVVLTNVGSVTVAPGNNPAVLSATSLATGTDDHATATAVMMVAALANFSDQYGTGAVAIPGYPASAVGAGLVAHAQALNRVALIAVAPASLASDAKSAVTTLRSLLSGGSETAGLFYPAIQTADGGVVRTITPEGFVAACRARGIMAAGGPWVAPAGQTGLAKWIVGVDTAIDRPTGDDLNANNVSAIRVISAGVGNTRPRLYGWRSLSTDATNYYMLKDRDTLNYITQQAYALLEPYVFSTVDAKGQLLSRVQSDLLGMLEPIRAAGGLYAAYNPDGSQSDPGYLVDVGPSVNTTATLAANQLNAKISVRIAPTAELINLSITKAAATASL